MKRHNIPLTRAKEKGWDWHRLIRLGVLIVIPALLYAPALGGGIPYPPGESVFSDFLISHYPNLLYLKHSLFHFHQIPLWNTTIYAGTPFAADPLSGLFYPPNWLALLLPLPAGISIAVAAHGILAAWGMDRFLFKLRVGEQGALGGALCFALAPKLAAHFGAGHISLLFALAWTPWLFAASLQKKGGWLLGGTAGLLFLADPRWAVYAGLLWVLFVIAYRQRLVLLGIKEVLRAVLLAVLIASPLLLPLMEFARLSTRSAMTAADLLSYRLPLSGIIDLIIPTASGNTEWYFYAGGSVLALVFFQFFMPPIRRKNHFWLGAAGFSIFLALGYWGGMGHWLVKVPGISLLRVPARSLFLVSFCLAVVAGQAIDGMMGLRKEIGGQKLSLFGLLAFAALFGLGIVIAVPGVQVWTLWGLIAMFAMVFALLLIPRVDSSWKAWTAVMVVIACDLLGAGWGAYQVKAPVDHVAPAILSELTQDQDDFRVYSPSYSIPQIEAVKASLELADGVDPLQIAAYADFMARAGGAAPGGYAVSIPPFKTGDPQSDNLDAEPDAALLGLLNVKYILSQFPVKAAGLELLATSGDQFLYGNEMALPRAWLEAEDSEGDLPLLTGQEVELVERSPNRIELRSSGQGRIVLSEIDYPGWIAYVDQSPAPLEKAYGLLRSVTVGPGDHDVLFLFRPLSVYLGLGLALAGWLWIGYGFTRK